MTYEASFSLAYLTRHIILALPGIRGDWSKRKVRPDVLDRNSAPNNAYSKAVCCGEGGDYSGVPFQWEYHSLHTQEFDRV